jgi:hypothetical protein
MDIIGHVSVAKIVSGGQSGVDRAALDAALELQIPYGGWCPAGGAAEDMGTPPGLLEHYPQMSPTPSDDPAQRTKWNVRDSDATLILVLGSAEPLSPGTDLTRRLAVRMGKPCALVDLSQTSAASGVASFISSLGRPVLNVAGPRESQVPGVYAAAFALLTSGVLASETRR